MTHVKQDNNCSILIVDDVPQDIQVIANIMQNEGYRMAFAQDGRTALKKVGEIIFDLILLDVVMPEMDGFDVCRILKGSRNTMEIPVIFLTAKTEAEDIVHGFEAGAVDYVAKPFNSSELLVRVRTHVELKKKRDREKELVSRLEAALAEIKQLSGLLPICSGCKKIRDDEGYWQQLEQYFSNHSDVRFTHGVCPDCIKKIYPAFASRVLKD
ncbi:MAG: response regulator [Deltaproteobacteria bacterium]|nr:response regulator [Deltaproteobacteria bacterium]